MFVRRRRGNRNNAVTFEYIAVDTLRAHGGKVLARGVMAPAGGVEPHSGGSENLPARHNNCMNGIKEIRHAARGKRKRILT